MKSTEQFAFRVEDLAARWKITLFLNGVAVSGMAIVKKQMQIGSAVVRQGGVAGVWTDEAHRKKGYASRVMWEGVSWMEKQNYDMSILFGISDFYHRYGYAPAFAEQSMTVSSARLQTLGAPYGSRKLKTADLPALKRVYRQYNAGRSGMDARREIWTPTWRMPRMGEGTTRRNGQVTVISDPANRMKGFVVWDAQMGRLVVSEVCGVDRSALETIGSVIGRRAKREGADDVRFCLPQDDPFLDFCRSFGYSSSANYPYNSGSMGRIVCLASLMKKMEDVFSDRIRMSPVSWSGDLVIKTDIGTVGLQVGVNGVCVTPEPGRPQIQISQMALTQLVMGYRAVADLAHDSEVSIPRRLWPILDALFPKGNPYMWWTDRF
ncbi:MAG: GNAT family N-acetyltransferase [bacterium]|nr:GNAT family N-acetyltransferase [bacterium]